MRLGTSKISWKYAVGEVILIFIGINLSLLFSNWNEKRIERNNEVKLLAEFKVSLEKDLMTLDTIMKWENTLVSGLEFVIKRLESKTALDDSMTLRLSYLTAYDIPSFQKSAYESIRTIGFQSISNDSIRIKLTEIQIAQNFDWIERTMDSHIEDYTLPLSISAFSYYRSFEKAIPEDYNKLKLNKILPRILRKSISYHKVIINSCEEIKVMTRKAVRLIEQEIHK